MVDGAGAIVANFSVSDVRHLAKVTNQADAEAALSLPLMEFLGRWGAPGRGVSSLAIVCEVDVDSLWLGCRSGRFTGGDLLGHT